MTSDRSLAVIHGASSDLLTPMERIFKVVDDPSVLIRVDGREKTKDVFRRLGESDKSNVGSFEPCACALDIETRGKAMTPSIQCRDQMEENIVVSMSISTLY